MKSFSYFRCVLSHIIISHRLIAKYSSVLSNLQETHFFLFIRKIAKKSYKINQNQHHVINNDSMLRMRNTNDLLYKNVLCHSTLKRRIT